MTTQAQILNDVKKDSIAGPFYSRFSIRTNATDWVLTTPNIGVEFDFSSKPITRFSVLANVKYNPNTHHSVQPRFVYNTLGATVEARKYWRTGFPTSGPMPRYGEKKVVRASGDTVTLGVSRDTTIAAPLWAFRKFRRNVLSGRTFTDPRTWRAYYAGIYAGYDKFTICGGKNGKQGDSYNFGFSGGWSIPLYPMRNGRSIDVDLGLAVGAKYIAYDEFKYNEEFGCYAYSGTRSRHFVPYPVIQDIHIAFVFRFRSIAEKVKGGERRYEEWDSRQQEKRAKRLRIRNENWDKRKHAVDSIRKAEKAEQAHRDSVMDDVKLQRWLDDVKRNPELADTASQAYKKYKAREMREEQRRADKAARKKAKQDKKKNNKKGDAPTQQNTPAQAAPAKPAAGDDEEDIYYDEE